MTTTATGISLSDVLDAGLKVTAYSEWHDESKNERFCWHASQLSGCPRQAILKRAGYPMDTEERDQAMLLQQAQMIHRWMEACITAYCDDPANQAELVVAEVGFRHPTLNLAAKPDAVLRARDRLVIFDWKTEKEGGVARRRQDAEQNGSTTHARPEHQIQLTATAMVLEQNGVAPIVEGRIGYISRQEWWVEECPVDVQDPLLRAEVERKLVNLDALWADYERAHLLPHRYPEDHWNCRPRKDSPPKGKYCVARSTCYSPRMPA